MLYSSLGLTYRIYSVSINCKPHYAVLRREYSPHAQAHLEKGTLTNLTKGSSESSRCRRQSLSSVREVLRSDPRRASTFCNIFRCIVVHFMMKRTPIRNLIFRNNKDAGSVASEEPLTPSKDDEADATMNLRSARSWHVRIPPIKKHMVGGHLVPTVRNALGFFAQPKRLIRVEVRSGSTADKDNDDDTLHDDDAILFRILRKIKGSSEDDDEEEEDHSMVGASVGEQSHNAGIIIEEEDGSHWKEHRRYQLEDLQILKTHSNKTVEVRLGAGHEVVVRDIKFETAEEAQSFRELYDRMGRLQQDRTQRQIERYKKESSAKPTAAGQHSSSPSGGETTRALLSHEAEILLLVDIVGATNLPIGDISSADPYVIVRMSGKEIHRTKVVHKELDPVWTLENGALFSVQMAPEEFFASSGGMSFVIKDFDSMGSNEILGTVSVPLEVLLKGDGERTEFLVDTGNLSPKQGVTNLFLRFKKASESDMEFLRVFHNNNEKLGVYLNETYLPVRSPASKMLRAQKKRDKEGNMLFRVKPFPDPDREEETKWMTEQQIETESAKESTHWVESGSGALGKSEFCL